MKLFLIIFRDEQILDEDNKRISTSDKEESKDGVKNGLQTFVFSATLSKDLQRNFKKRSRPKSGKKHYKREEKPASTLGKMHPLITSRYHLTPDDLR